MEENHLRIFVRYCFEFGPVMQEMLFIDISHLAAEEMSFKDISYLDLWQPFCSVEQNHICNFG